MSTLYSDLKMFHFQKKLDSLPLEQSIQPPLHVRLKPTNSCNHACRYCSYRDPKQQLGKDMRIADSIPRAKMLEIANDLVEMGVNAVTYSGGGEPLTYPHLLEASRILAKGGVKLACLTNGALLNDEKAEFFAHNAVWVRVSMDGWDGPSYARYRGVSDKEFSKVLRNIESFTSMRGKCALGVSYIVDNENCHHLRPMLQRLKESGVSSVKVSACIVSNDPEECNRYHAPHFATTQEALDQAIADLSDAHFEIVDAWHTIDSCFEKDYNWCPYIQIKPVIAADQCVYPCQDKAYVNEAVLGSIREQSFRTFWENSKKNLFSIDPQRHCRHHCMTNTKNKMLLNYLDVDYQHIDFV